MWLLYLCSKGVHWARYLLCVTCACRPYAERLRETSLEKKDESKVVCWPSRSAAPTKATEHISLNQRRSGAHISQNAPFFSREGRYSVVFYGLRHLGRGPTFSTFQGLTCPATMQHRYNLLGGNYSIDKPSAVFSVDAWERWSPSAFAIQEGETSKNRVM